MGSAGPNGSQPGARPKTQPSGSDKPQNASIWITMGARVTL